MMKRFQRIGGLIAIVVSGWLTLGSGHAAALDAAASSEPIAETAERVLVVVSDDDFLAVDQTLWCERRLRQLIAAGNNQPDGPRYQWEGIAAGPPALLRGGTEPAGPRRAIVLLCDQQRRVLTFCIGVPSQPFWATLNEDADELVIAAQLTTAVGTRLGKPEHEPSIAPVDEAPVDEAPADEAPVGEGAEQRVVPEQEEVASRSVAIVRQRAAQRVIRHYRPLIGSIEPFRTLEENAQRLSEALAADIRERFLIDDLADRPRWTSVQQHAEARQYWCDAMLASIVDQPVDEVWPALAACVWGGQPWRRPLTDEAITGEAITDEGVTGEAAAAAERVADQQPIVLRIDDAGRYLGSDAILPQSPMTRAPSPFASAGRRSPGQQAALSQQAAPVHARLEQNAALQQKLAELNWRSCDLCELAVILSRRESEPVRLASPNGAAASWIVLDGKTREPNLLFGRSEGRLLNLIRRW